MSETTQATQTSNTLDSTEEKAELTPQLYREVADKVFAMLVKDLQIEKERQRTPSLKWFGR